MDHHPKILVVGSGPTGLTLANELFRLGVSCRLVDQAAEPLARSRAIGLSTRSLEVLAGFDASAEAVELGHQLRAAHIYSRGRQLATVSTDGLRGTRYPFVLALPQYRTEEVLRNSLARLGGTVEWNVRLTGLTSSADGRNVIATLDGPEGPQQWVADWVVGADGAHSAVRELTGIEFAGAATDIVFTIVDARVERGPARGTAHYFFSPDGLLVVVPLPDDSYRFAATVAGDAGSGRLDRDEVQALIDRRVPGGGIRISQLHDAGWGATRVTIHNRLAARFRVGRCLLAGDAAHVHSPVGGQGVNVGIQDAHNLAWKLALVATGRAPEALLDSYQTERQPVARLVTKGVDMQTRLAALRSPIGAKLRDTLLARAGRRGTLRRRLVPTLAQLGIGYAGSPAIAAADKSTPFLGRRVPDTPVASPAGGPDTVFGLCGPEFTVLALGATSAAIEVTDSLRARYGALVSVRAVGRPGSGAEFVDRDGALHAQLSVTKPQYCLVRPDGHLAAQGTPAAITTQLDRMVHTAVKSTTQSRG